MRSKWRAKGVERSILWWGLRRNWRMIFLKMFMIFAFQEGLSWSYGVCIDVNLCFQFRAATENPGPRSHILGPCPAFSFRE